MGCLAVAVLHTRLLPRWTGYVFVAAMVLLLGPVRRIPHAQPQPRRRSRQPDLRPLQEAASHADPRTTMRYDRARTSLDRHATYIVAAFIARAAR